jgi:uncharacterized membrane protein YqjE
MGLKDSFLKFLRINEIKYALIGLVEAKLELKKLEVQEKFGEQLTNIIYALITLIIGLIILIFFSILIAAGLNLWLESAWYGFAITGAFYIVLLIFWIGKEFAAKKKINEQIEQQLEEQFSKIKIL